MGNVNQAENILKILPVSLEDCYGASSKGSDGHAKRKNTFRAGSNGGRRKRSPAANQPDKSYCNRKRVVKKSCPDTSGPQAIPGPAP